MQPKSGFLSSEFWLSIMALLTPGLTGILLGLPDVLKHLPGMWGVVVGGLAATVSSPAAVWLAKHYGTGRVELKKNGGV